MHRQLPLPLHPPRHHSPCQIHELTDPRSTLATRGLVQLVRQRTQSPRRHHHRPRHESFLLGIGPDRTTRGAGSATVYERRDDVKTLGAHPSSQRIRGRESEEGQETHHRSSEWAGTGRWV